MRTSPRLQTDSVSQIPSQHVQYRMAYACPFFIHLDLAKFDQPRFHISIFRWLETQGKRQDPKTSRSAHTYGALVGV